MNKKMKVSQVTFQVLLVSYFTLLNLPGIYSSKQAESLVKLIRSRREGNGGSSDAEMWPELAAVSKDIAPVYIAPQKGLMEADKIGSLPGQPEGVDFDQYAGYVNIDPRTGKSLFYYFVESPHDSSGKPLVLWLNGGPGCSSLGYGAMQELGPFRVNPDGKTLYHNDYAWNNVGNVLFLESPAGVGFSYSNTSSGLISGDNQTAEDSYTFLVNWLERFPQYKNRDFFIAGESYAGHYVPQLASLIVSKNKNANYKVINLIGIAIGNAWMDDKACTKGLYDFYWSHALISDQTHEAINKYCDYVVGNFSITCSQYQSQADAEYGKLDMYNIYAPVCNGDAQKPAFYASINKFDPCTNNYVESYMNLAEVQEALHAKRTSWSSCGGLKGWTGGPSTILPVIEQLIAAGLRIWIYSGDVDGVVPVTTSRYSINALKLPVEEAWRPWYLKKEVGGYVVGYKGVVLTTVRGAGHEVPSYKPEQALAMISYFLRGKLPPSS